MEDLLLLKGIRVRLRESTNTSNGQYCLQIDYDLGMQGSVSTAITADSSGAKIADVRYAPWGSDRYTSGTMPTTYRFTGQRLEDYIKLYWIGSRWYDPELGRWIQPDVIVPEAVQGVQAWDRMAYVNNNPLRYADLSGHMLTECGKDGSECRGTDLADQSRKDETSKEPQVNGTDGTLPSPDDNAQDDLKSHCNLVRVGAGVVMGLGGTLVMGVGGVTIIVGLSETSTVIGLVHGGAAVAIGGLVFFTGAGIVMTGGYLIATSNCIPGISP